MSIKAIIFDWGRTLFDPDTRLVLSDSEEVLSYCKQKGYIICVVSLVRPPTTISEREEQIGALSLGKFITYFEVTDAREKDEVLDELIKKLSLPKEEILMVDDRVVKSIKYGNKNGHPTVWLQKGTFANELPNEETGTPTFTINSLSELKNII